MIKIIPRLTAMKIIRVYQKTLSLDHGPLRHLHPHGFCRFHPTCSEYGYQSIEKNGLIKGSIATSWRILRCNPWNAGGNDPVDKVDAEK